MRVRRGSVTIDMTQGNILNLLLRFAIPVLFGTLFQEIYTLSDTMIAGYMLGDNALGSIGSTLTIYNLMLGFANGMSGGCGVVVAKHFGASDMKGVKQSAGVMLLVSLAFGAFFSLLGCTCTDTLLWIMNIPAAMLTEARAYLSVIAGGMLVTVLYNMCAGYMRALGNSVMPLVFLIMSCILNVILDYVLISLGMGVAAAAWATVIAQGGSTLLCAVYIYCRMREYLPDRNTPMPRRALVGDMIWTGISMGLMHSVVATGSVIMQSATNGLGEVSVTVFTGIRRLVSLSAQPQSAFTMAGATFVGQNKGAGAHKRIRQGIRWVLLLQAIWSGTAGAILLLWGKPIFQFLIGTQNQEILDLAAYAIIPNAILLIPLGILVAVRTMMQSLGMHFTPVFASAIELIMKVVFALTVVPVWGFRGASWAEPSTWLVCTVFILGVYFIRRRSLFPDLQPGYSG